jgi:hypothetical protein
MRMNVSQKSHTSTYGGAQCLACHGPLESHSQTVLDTYEVELWWCRDCNVWWGSGSSHRDVNDRADFCRTPPAALAARIERLSSLDDTAFARRS